MRRQRKLVALTILLGLAATLAEGIGISLFIPFLQAIGDQSAPVRSGGKLVEFMTGFFGDNLSGKLPIIALWIFVALSAKALLSYAADLSYSVLDSRLGHGIRVGLNDQLLKVGFSFLENTRDERILNTMVSESWKATRAVSIVAYLAIVSCTLLIYTALLLLISWKLTILVAVSMFAISRLVRLLRKRVEILGRVATWANLRLTGRMLETVYGLEAIRSYGMESRSANRFNSASERVSHSFVRLSVISGLVGPIYEILTAGLLVILLYVSFESTASVPAILVFIFILHRLQPKIKSLDGTWLSMESMKAPVNEVLWLLDETDKPYLPGGSETIRALTEGIHFEDVSFAYDRSGTNALKDVNLTIRRGSTTALVGPSGAGKTTLAKLILRFYDPTVGRITVDGKDLRSLNGTDWRKLIAVVNQDPYVFNASIWDNIAFGVPGATSGDIESAAQAADAAVFIDELPRKYRTLVGDNGALLSGGQKQRVSLARALVRNPDLLILDEATNALDSISENAIHEALNSLPPTCTKVIIAHRLSTIESADQIVVLEDGRVVEVGTLRELLDRNGLFADLYRRQNQGQPAFK